MPACNAAVSVNYKGSRNRNNSTVGLNHFLVSHHNRVVHPKLSDELLHYFWSLFVQRDPTTARPLSAYPFCSSTKCGISTRQGTHHVAQKSRITTLPLKSDSLTCFPSKSFSSQPGAVTVSASLTLPETALFAANAQTSSNTVKLHTITRSVVMKIRT